MKQGDQRRLRLAAASLLNTAPEEGRLPPQAPELEQGVLGAAMLEKDAYEEASFLQPGMFYVEAHARIWEAIGAVHETGAQPDIMLVTEELKRRGELDVVGGPFYISTLANKVASSANVEFHARIIQQKFMLREQIRISAEIQSEAYGDGADVFDIADKMQLELDKAMEGAHVEGTVSLKELADEELMKVDAEKVPAHSTGWPSLDKKINGGWIPGDFWIMSARPGMGKTAGMVSLAIDGVKATGEPVLIFQAEVSRTPMNNRLVAADTGIPLSNLTAGNMSTYLMQRRNEAHDRFSNLPVYLNFSDSPTMGDIRRETSRYIRKHGIKKVFIDQANWIKYPEEMDTRQGLAFVSRSCRRLAKSLDITVVLLHQMNRDVTKRTGHLPSLADLRDSGSFENDAQGVMFWHRPEYYGDTEDHFGNAVGRGDLIIAKYSNGEPCTIHFHFDKETATYRDTWNAHEPAPADHVPHPDDRTDPTVARSPGPDNEDLPF